MPNVLRKQGGGKDEEAKEEASDSLGMGGMRRMCRSICLRSHVSHEGSEDGSGGEKGSQDSYIFFYYLKIFKNIFLLFCRP